MNRASMGGLRTPCGAPPLPITAGADIRALAVDIEQLRNRAWMRRSIVDFCLERGQRTLTVLRKAASWSPPARPGTARASDLAIP